MAAQTQTPDTSSLPNGRRVIEIDARRDPRWDAFVLATPGGTPFHLGGWLAALEHESGLPPIALACQEADGQLVGILPLQRTRGLPFGIGSAALGARLSSLPRTPVGGPIAADAAATRALVNAAARIATQAGLLLQLKLDSPHLDGLLPGLTAMPWRPRYVKELPNTPDALRFGNSRNHARIRWAVGKAERAGVTVREASSERDLRAWFELYLEVNRWHCLPSRPYRFFRAAWRALRPAHLRLLLAERDGADGQEMLAGALLVTAGTTTHYVFNGRRRSALLLRPNDLLQWKAMRDAAAAGLRWYDFGEVDEHNEGLAGFKSKWDTEQRRLFRYHLPAIARAEVGYNDLDTDDGRLRRAATEVWRRVPIGLTAIAGDGVYRFL